MTYTPDGRGWAAGAARALAPPGAPGDRQKVPRLIRWCCASFLGRSLCQRERSRAGSAEAGTSAMSSIESSPRHLERGREEYQRHDWAAAYASLGAADQTTPLGVEDLDRMAFAAELSGDSEAFLKTTERIYE